MTTDRRRGYATGYATLGMALAQPVNNIQRDETPLSIPGI